MHIFECACDRSFHETGGRVGVDVDKKPNMTVLHVRSLSGNDLALSILLTCGAEILMRCKWAPKMVDKRLAYVSRVLSLTQIAAL